MQGVLSIYPHDIDKEIQKAFDIANEANLGGEELELQHKKERLDLYPKKLDRVSS
jgi:hypothetical protein